ncbi:hypothetical protein ACFV8T_34415 [Streptomyces sp. NPDC059832]
MDRQLGRTATVLSTTGISYAVAGLATARTFRSISSGLEDVTVEYWLGW